MVVLKDPIGPFCSWWGLFCGGLGLGLGLQVLSYPNPNPNPNPILWWAYRSVLTRDGLQVLTGPCTPVLRSANLCEAGTAAGGTVADLQAAVLALVDVAGWQYRELLPVPFWWEGAPALPTAAVAQLLQCSLSLTMSAALALYSGSTTAV